MRGRRPKVDEHRAADPAAVKAGALALLARREYASGELAKVLVRKGYDADIAREVVAELAGERLLDDSRYAASLVRMLSGRGQGPVRIRQALAEAGLSATQIDAALEEGPDWQSAARDVRTRKFGARVPASWPERARQMRALQYRGFSRDQITAALDGAAVSGDAPDENDSP